VSDTNPKASGHVDHAEGLVFEKSASGKRGFELPPLDVPAVDVKKALGAEFARDEITGFPEVSEIEVIRHFTRLSTWNYAIDLGMYPLGSCTMKYNPRVNEFVARLDGIATEHPYQPIELSQGCL
jgi:glycine dehydrogenase subunit 2